MVVVTYDVGKMQSL